MIGVAEVAMEALGVAAAAALPSARATFALRERSERAAAALNGVSLTQVSVRLTAQIPSSARFNSTTLLAVVYSFCVC